MTTTYEMTNHHASYQAILELDKRYDGLFFFAVKTTGVYCLPSCPAPRSLEKNVTFYHTVDSARKDGFRACKRCHPDRLKDNKVHAILKAFQNSESSNINIRELAGKPDITDRHMRRIVQEKTGTSPMKLKQAKRLNAARLLLIKTQLPVTDVAFNADFSSLRQFNHAFKKAFALTPQELRTQGSTEHISLPASLNLKLSYKQPMEWQPLINGLIAHATPHLEHYNKATNTLVRYLQEDGRIVKVTIDLKNYEDHVRVKLETEDLAVIDRVVARVKRLMDLDHEPIKANDVLSRDPLLAPMVAKRPGLHIIGSFSPFELMIFTIIGQQISVAAARTFAGRLVKEYGEPYENDGLYLFPSTAVIANVDPMEMYERTKFNHKKVATLQAFAKLIDNGLELENAATWVKTILDLLAVKGIGPWSVEYLALRGMGDPNAFPADDLLIKRRLGTKNAKEVILASKKWRPFRGYGTMHIWAEGAYL